MKSQIQKKKKKRENAGIVELLIQYQHFSRKSFSWGDKNFFGIKNYEEVVLNWITNDQIMPKFGRSFINDKCIFQ